MANEWVDFVKQYAKENNISYSHALKEAGSAYRSRKKRGKSTLRGKGLGDLPSEIIGNIGKNLDNKDLKGLSITNRKINNDLKAEFSREYGILINEVLDSIQRYNRSSNLTKMNNEAENMPQLLERLQEIQQNPLASEQQQTRTNFLMNSLDQLLLMNSISNGRY
jgi:hypothetical protein